jgi:Mg-chelatase subunit ChlI
MNHFPFTAIVGMERAKRSLIFHAIDPRIGGTLLLGHRGCAKSTLVRAFAEILEGTAAGPAPFLELPLGASEDRLLGSVNAAVLMEKGQWEEKPGLIAQAHGGVLYVDEINLLPDHLADLILDSAASGQYRLERDGITRQMESRYVLVGTMNPEEGDLRPQLSDRFGHGVRISDDFSAEERVLIVERRMAFDDAPAEFEAVYADATRELKRRVTEARAVLQRVQVASELRHTVAQKARELQLEGIRAELAVVRTARCAAAWEGRPEVSAEDLEEAWELCLGHRVPDSAPPPSGPSQSQPPSSGMRQEPPRQQQQPRRETPQMPLDAQREPVRIRQESIPWELPLTVQPRLAAERVVGASRVFKQPTGPVAWSRSLCDAFLNGWKPGGGFPLFRSCPPRRESVWCFLDASRSTGASGFLEKARAGLEGLALRLKTARYHFLVLEEGCVRWSLRNGSARRFTEVLRRVHLARGKSLIPEAFKQLHRARLRGHGPSRVVLATDGLASPVPGESVASLQSRLRARVARLCEGGPPLLWLQPAPKRGLASWLPRVCRGLRVESVEV